MKSLHASVYILLGACSYGIHASLVKIGIAQNITISEITSSQYIIGILLLLLVLPFTKKKSMNRRQLFELLGIGVLVGLTGVFYGLSLAKIPASIAVVMLFQFTWIGLLIESVYLRSVPSRKKLVSVGFLWVGTFLAGSLVSSTGFQWSENIEGIVYGFLGAITFALFLFFSGKVAKGIPTVQKSVLTILGGSVVVCGMLQPAFLSEPSRFVDIWEIGVIVSLFGSILPIVFFALGTPHLESSISTIIGAAELPAAIIAAMVLLHEDVSVLQSIGILLILIGIAIPQLTFRFQKPQKQFSQ